MFLLFIRHGIAAPLGQPAALDKDRPLTVRGARRFRQTALALARLVGRPKAILVSPLLRARQTAELAAKAWGGPRPVAVPALCDGQWSGICRAITEYGPEDTVVLVGHEDWMSTVTARLLGSESRQAFGYRKGGVALLELEKPDASLATLVWFIPPRVLRRL